MKRIAIAVFALCFVAVPARADGIKALTSTIGMGGISSAICVLTAMYSSDEEDASGEDFDRRGFFIGLGGTFAGEDFSDKPVRDIVDIFGASPRSSNSSHGSRSVPFLALGALIPRMPRRYWLCSCQTDSLRDA